MRALKLTVAVLGIAAAFAAAGCGGDGGGGEALSAEEFREQADAICNDFEAQLQEVEPPTSPDDIERFVDEAVPIIEDGTGELNSLQPPSEFQDEWDRVVEIN